MPAHNTLNVYNPHNGLFTRFLPPEGSEWMHNITPEKLSTGI